MSSRWKEVYKSLGVDLRQASHADKADDFLSAILFRGGMASAAQYNSKEDTVTVFECDDASTMYHELTHWTGHPSRLDRIGGGREPSAEDRFLEEATAVAGSVFLTFYLDGREPTEDEAKIAQGNLAYHAKAGELSKKQVAKLLKIAEKQGHDALRYIKERLSDV